MEDIERLAGDLERLRADTRRAGPGGKGFGGVRGLTRIIFEPRSEFSTDLIVA
jgi:hypothetical protein